MVPLSALLLKLTTKIFKIKDQSYKSAIIVVLIVFGIEFVLSCIKQLFPETFLLNWWFGIFSWILLSFLLAWLLIKKRYGLDWAKSILIWMVWAVFDTILSVVVSLLIVGFILSLIIGLQPSVQPLSNPTGNIILNIFK